MVVKLIYSKVFYIFGLFVSIFLSPYHAVNDPGIALNDLDDLIRNILVDIIRHRDPQISVTIHRYRQIHRLKQTFAVDAG